MHCGKAGCVWGNVLPYRDLASLCHPAQVLTTPVSRDMLGRVFNGSGKPIDGGCVFKQGHLLYSHWPDSLFRVHTSIYLQACFLTLPLPNAVPLIADYSLPVQPPDSG